MKVFDNQTEYRPKSIYPDLDFAQVKSTLKSSAVDYTDYGSLLMIKDENLALCINNIGRVIVFYNHFDENTIKNKITEIENAFKSEIKDFQILH